MLADNDFLSLKPELKYFSSEIHEITNIYRSLALILCIITLLDCDLLYRNTYYSDYYVISISGIKLLQLVSETCYVQEFCHLFIAA